MIWNKRPEKRNYSPAASIDIGIAHIMQPCVAISKINPAGTGIKLERPRQLVNDILDQGNSGADEGRLPYAPPN
jgi:hypothetical protein